MANQSEFHSDIFPLCRFTILNKLCHAGPITTFSLYYGKIIIASSSTSGQIGLYQINLRQSFVPFIPELAGVAQFLTYVSASPVAALA